MLKTLIVSALCAMTVGSTSTLQLFQTDYDANCYSVEPVVFEIPADVPEGWYPLRAAAEHLPIDVSWDSATQEVVVFSEAVQNVRPMTAERRFKASRLPVSLCIRRGVTYCSPQFLSGMLPGISFRHDGQVYAFAGEAVKSREVQGGSRFRSWCLTSMYRLKLISPNEYDFIREHLKGVTMDYDRGEFPVGATSYIYPKKAVCHILDTTAYGAQLAGYIAHESYHVWQYRTGVAITEKSADAYASRIVTLLIYSN